MLAAALASVRRQTLDAWELCLVDDGSRDARVIELLDRAVAEDQRIRLTRRDHSGGISAATNDALRTATGEYVACMDHDDELADDALEAVADAINKQPDADLLYTDEDLVLDGQPEDIALKPGWSPDLFRSTMYLAHLHVTRRSLALEIGGFRSEFDGSQDYDFILRVSEQARRIVHIPRVLYHWRVHQHSVIGSETAKPYAYSAARRAVEEHLRRTGVDGEVHFGAFPGVTRVVHRLPPDVRAAVVLPVAGEARITARDVARAAHSWAMCEYRPHELILIGTPDLIAACAERLPDGFPGRVVAIEAPPDAGWAAAINTGASAAESEYLVGLDGPVESLTRDWLSRLVGFASQPEVGAAGGKVLAADGRVDNAGVLLSDGLAMPVLHGAHAGRERPLGIGRIPFNLSAVSGAVAIRHETFNQFGGLDEPLGPLGIADYCLRARESGMRIVSASDAVLRRVELAVPVNDLAALHAFRMRWRDRVGRDPYFHPGYYSDRGDFMFRPDVYGWEVANRWKDA
jgi:glycosyltransferase involved in cell wall biosynthesis